MQELGRHAILGTGADPRPSQCWEVLQWKIEHEHVSDDPNALVGDGSGVDEALEGGEEMTDLGDGGITRN